jgi:hypothetical protein
MRGTLVDIAQPTDKHPGHAAEVRGWGDLG